MKLRTLSRLLAAAALATGVLAAPVAGQAPTAGQAPSAEPDRYSAAAADAEHYRLGVADHVRIIVFNEPTLSGEFTVAANGKLAVPLIGDVPALGKQPDEVAALIQSQLKDGYLRDPKVSAEVTQFRPFFVLGEVKSPGQYPYAIGLTAYNAIATAQGFTPRSERKNVFIRKQGDDRERPYKLSPDLRVLPGDTIRVGERYF